MFASLASTMYDSAAEALGFAILGLLGLIWMTKLLAPKKTEEATGQLLGGVLRKLFGK